MDFLTLPSPSLPVLLHQFQPLTDYGLTGSTSILKLEILKKK